MVLPDLLATINKVRAKSIGAPLPGWRVGSVESSTKKRRPRRRRKHQRENLGREARTAHAQQHNVAQAGSPMITRRKSSSCGRFRAHGVEHRNPAEAIGDDLGVLGIVFPQARLPGPDLGNGLGGAKPVQFLPIGIAQAAG